MLLCMFKHNKKSILRYNFIYKYKNVYVCVTHTSAHAHTLRVNCRASSIEGKSLMQYTRVGRGFQLFCQLEPVGSSIWKLLMSTVLGHTKANKNNCQDQVEMSFLYGHRSRTSWSKCHLFVFLILRTSNLRKSWWINLEKIASRQWR